MSNPDATEPRWWQQRPVLLEAFVCANLAFLTIDVYVAHSYNRFGHWAEWIPLLFAIVGSIALVVNLWMGYIRAHQRYRVLGSAVGWAAVLVGVAGMVYHLEPWFFEAASIQSLVYSAPFVAPLAFAGLGLLLIHNRTTDADTYAWGQWVVFLAWGGLAGNFVLSLIDHAQNGFFYWTEWIPVGAGAIAVGYFASVLLLRPTRLVFWVGYGVIALQVAVGLLGFALHIAPVFGASSMTALWDDVVYGAPVFAPLLFVDIAVLCGLGLWDMQAKLEQAEMAAA